MAVYQFPAERTRRSETIDTHRIPGIDLGSLDGLRQPAREERQFPPNNRSRLERLTLANSEAPDPSLHTSFTVHDSREKRPSLKPAGENLTHTDVVISRKVADLLALNDGPAQQLSNPSKYRYLLRGLSEQHLQDIDGKLHKYGQELRTLRIAEHPDLIRPDFPTHLADSFGIRCALGQPVSLRDLVDLVQRAGQDSSLIDRRLAYLELVSAHLSGDKRNPLSSHLGAHYRKLDDSDKQQLKELVERLLQTHYSPDQWQELLTLAQKNPPIVRTPDPISLEDLLSDTEKQVVKTTRTLGAAAGYALAAQIEGGISPETARGLEEGVTNDVVAPLASIEHAGHYYVLTAAPNGNMIIQEDGEEHEFRPRERGHDVLLFTAAMLEERDCFAGTQRDSGWTNHGGDFRASYQRNRSQVALTGIQHALALKKGNGNEPFTLA